MILARRLNCQAKGEAQNLCKFERDEGELNDGGSAPGKDEWDSWIQWNSAPISLFYGLVYDEIVQAFHVPRKTMSRARYYAK